VQNIQGLGEELDNFSPGARAVEAQVHENELLGGWQEDRLWWFGLGLWFADVAVLDSRSFILHRIKDS
jgi:hypothetical protein